MNAGRRHSTSSMSSLASEPPAWVIYIQDVFAKCFAPQQQVTAKPSMWLELQFWLMDAIPNAVYFAFFAFVAGLLLWGLVASVLLILASELYTHSAVKHTRERWAAAAAQRLGVEASGVMSAAFASRDALSYAIQRRLYVEPLDYTAIRRALEPVFVASQATWAVELGFIGRNTSITVRKRMANLTRMTMIVQSDAPDCRRALGHVGCLTRSTVPAQETLWYKLGLDLPGGQETDLKYAVSAIADADSAFRWMDSPSFVALDPNTSSPFAAAQNNVPWEPAYSLLFRILFPGSGGTLSLIGRVVLKLSALRDEHMLDAELLGPQGCFFICDERGTLLVASRPGLQVVQQKPTGRVRFRRAWELQFPWAEDVEESDFQGGARQFDTNGFHVAITPLHGRGLSNFYAMVVVQRDGFTDSSYSSYSIAAKVMVAMPYPVALLIFLAYYAHAEYKRRKALQRVQPSEWGDSMN